MKEILHTTSVGTHRADGIDSIIVDLKVEPEAMKTTRNASAQGVHLSRPNSV